MVRALSRCYACGMGWQFLAAMLGFLAVAAGAFGAHALRTRLSPGDLDIFETAARYQMYHALALWLAATLSRKRRSAPLRGACVAFAVGVLVFSGSLYLLVFTGVRQFGAITPLGGVALLLGWALVAADALRRRP